MEGDFRAGAVDADMGRGGVKLWEADPNSKNGGGLDRAVVARECIRSVDLGVRHAFMPGYVRCVVFVFFLLCFVKWDPAQALILFGGQVRACLLLDLAEFDRKVGEG